jgi:hypothetical protein
MFGTAMFGTAMFGTATFGTRDVRDDGPFGTSIAIKNLQFPRI